MVTEESVMRTGDAAIEKNRAENVEKIFQISTGIMQHGIMEELRFAKGKLVKAIIDFGYAKEMGGESNLR